VRPCMEEKLLPLLQAVEESATGACETKGAGRAGGCSTLGQACMR
jgi:hypothetical protein